jgi:hypothetical protein
MLVDTEENHQKLRIVCVQAEIQTRYLPNTSDSSHLEPAFSRLPRPFPVYFILDHAVFAKRQFHCNKKKQELVSPIKSNVV